VKNSCLLVIDVQNDFCTGSLKVDGSLKIIAPINNLMRKFSSVIACQDWHPAHHKSFASQHGKKAGEVINLLGLEQVLWEDHCVQNTEGANFHPELETKYFEKVFQKGIHPDIDSYSAFYDVARKSSTGLSLWLENKEIKEIYMAGLATDYCVKFSALDALKDGFEVFVIQDLCRAVNLQAGDEEKTIEQLKAEGIQVINHQQIVF
jgi:nicotinamidase/pyrazinamidase